MEQLKLSTIITFFVGVLVGLFIMDLIQRSGIDNHVVTNYDTTYNKVKLDSLKFSIGKHDTTIYKLNIKLKDDVEKSYQLNDSATVSLFKQLTTTGAN